MKVDVFCYRAFHLIFWLLLFKGSALYSQSLLNYVDTGFIPFKMLKNTMLVPVTIGRHEYSFVFDTGGFLSISNNIRVNNRLHAIDSIEVSDIEGKVKYFDKVLIPHATLGDMELQNREALELWVNSKYPDNCFGADGMIGRDIFEGMILEFDYKNGRLRITNDRSKIQMPEDLKAKLRLSDRGLPEMLLRINGRKRWIEFDSGSGDFFSFKTRDVMNLRDVSENDKLKFHGIFSYGITGKGDVRPSVRYRPRVESLQIGKAIFKDFYSDFSKKTAPRTGAGILQAGKLILDFQEMGYYFIPYNQVERPVFESFGFDVAFLHGKYLVKWVLEGSQAAMKGLEYGLEIKYINGVSVYTFIDECQNYLHGFDFTKSDIVQLKYIDSLGNLESVTLEKKVY